MFRRRQFLRRYREKATISLRVHWVFIIHVDIVETFDSRYIHGVRYRSWSSMQTSYLALLLNPFLVLGFDEIFGCLLQFERLKPAIIFLELILTNEVEGLDQAIFIESFTIPFKIFYTSISLPTPL